MEDYLREHCLDGILSEQASRILKLLIQRYNEAGSKFLYVNSTYDCVLSVLGLSLDAIHSASLELHSSALCYYYYHKQFRDNKLGLKKVFIKELEEHLQGEKVESVQHARALQVPSCPANVSIRIGPAKAKRIHHRRFGTKGYSLPPEMCEALGKYCTRCNPSDRGKWRYYQGEGFTLAITPKGKAELRIKQHPHFVYQKLVAMLGKESAARLALSLVEPEAKSLLHYTYAEIEYPLEDPNRVLSGGNGRWLYPDGRHVDVCVDRSPGYPVFEVKGEPKASETLGDLTASPAEAVSLLLRQGKKIDYLLRLQEHPALSPSDNTKSDAPHFSIRSFKKLRKLLSIFKLKGPNLSANGGFAQ